MPHHIELTVEGKLLVHWTEDQPSIRPVKDYFMQTGVVGDLVGILRADKSLQVAKKEKELTGFLGDVFVQGQYLCAVQRWPVEQPCPSDPHFFVTIGRNDPRTPSDAVGYVYEAPFPEWLSEEARNIYALNLITLLNKAVVVKQRMRT